jgi:conjugal transfer pilus assembly protein TraB
MLEKFKSYISSPEGLKLWQRSKIVLLLVGSFLVATFIGNVTKKSSQNIDPSPAKEMKVTSPMDVVNPQHAFADRIEDRAKGAEERAQAAEEKAKILEKKIDLLTETIQKIGQSTSLSQDKEGEGTLSPSMSPPQLPEQENNSQEQSLPFTHQPSLSGESLPEQTEIVAQAKKSKIKHLSLSELEGAPIYNVSTYIPAGTHAKAILTSGVVASTATSASANPQPIVLRLADQGNLPRGFKGEMRDAVLIGACYGDLSSERAFCRLQTISWVEPSGETVERQIEGWILGEDGRPGIKGTVVDRAGEVARESLFAGILSGISNFLKFDATSSVYPVTPFGQTNALNTQNALKGAAGNGVGNALDKLADFSIKRAEQMQPVILVSSGRLVDVVFKKA